MNPSVQTVPIRVADREEFLQMAEQHFRELDAGFVPHEDWKRCYFERIQANPQFFLRWIVSGGQRAGFILFGLEDHRFLPRKTGAIYEVYVVPAYRRTGVARACAEQAIGELWKASPSKIQLEVVEGNTAAARLWQSLGFNKVTARYVLKGKAR